MKIRCALIVCFVALSLNGSILFTGSYSENFDTLPSSGSFSFTGTGPFNVPNNSGGSLAGWTFSEIAGSGANANFDNSTGSKSTGSIYSYGSSGSGERALGSLADATMTPRFGVALQNNSGSAYTSFTVTFRGEQWRVGGDGTVGNVLTFGYSLNASDINTGTFTGVSALNFGSLVTSGSARALDGNASGNFQNNISATSAELTGPPAAHWFCAGVISTMRIVMMDLRSTTFRSPPCPNPQPGSRVFLLSPF